MSGQDLANGFNAIINQWDRPWANVVVLIMLNAHCIQHRREQFACTYLTLNDLLAVFVGCPKNGSVFDAAA